MTTVYVSEENLKSLVHHKLHTAGLDTDTTQQVTDVLVYADITGVHSHGLCVSFHIIAPAPCCRRVK